MIEVHDLSRRYGEVLAVDHVTFEVQPGHVTGFLGPNGAGKSTTMRLALGLDRPTTGSVTIDGAPYRELQHPLRRVGALLDSRAVDGSRSARQHLRWLAHSNAIDVGRIDGVLDQVGLTAAAARRIGTYSLGMTQRLGIAAALLGDPSTVLFDEPMNGLDADGIHWLRTLLRTLADEGRTVLLSSHLMGEIAQTADHLVVIRSGRVVADAPTDRFLAGHADHVTVRTDRPSELVAAITALGGAVDRSPDTSLVVGGVDAVAIGRAAAARGIALAELTTHHVSLEDAFLELTVPEGALP
jgi:ABC-2 type transport system ATP-binding protein